MYRSFCIAISLIKVCISIFASTQPNYERVNALESEAWNSSQWISVADAPVVTGNIDDSTRAADGSNWFALSMTNEKAIKSAVWMTTALGVFELYVNGILIGDEILKPGFSHYQKTKYSFTFDITPSVKKNQGEKNVLSAQVTPGWWADNIITPRGNEGFVGKKCAFRSVLKVIYFDGSEKIYGTDTLNWVAGIAGRVKHADIFDGEIFDARENAGYESIEEFKTPEINTEFRGKIIPNQGAEVYLRNDLALNPVTAYIWEGIEGNNDNNFGRVLITKEYTNDDVIVITPGQTLIVDFGQNCAAVPSFLFNAKRGTSLICLPAEMLNELNGDKSCGMDGPEGSVYRENLRIPQTGMQLEYIFAGDEEESFIPRSTFFGYRYLSITSTDDITIKSIKSIPVSSITREMEIGFIETGNELVNKFIQNTRWSERSNYLSVPTDCPQRDERLGYTGDAQVFAEAGSFFANTNSFFRKWLQDLRDTQSPKCGFPGVAPFGKYCAKETNMMRVGWSDAGVIVPFTIWKQFGDDSIIEESWASMEKYLDHVNETKYNHDALKEENGNYQWADWLSFEPLEVHSGRYLGENGILEEALDYWNYLSASYWLIDSECMYYMAKSLGKDATKYSKMILDAKNYIYTTFFTSEGVFKNQILNTMQTPALFALKNKILNGKAKENLIALLRANFEQHDNCLQTGFLGTSILMQTLTENGMADIAYELLLNEKNPSWLYSVINGATTIWERCDAYIQGVGFNENSSMNSFNHYAYGSVCQWIWKTVAGISADPLQPGFKHIIMKPIPDKRLGFVNAEYLSAAGIIKSSWRFEGNDCIWDFSIPSGASASVTLPGETVAKEYSEGNYTIRLGAISTDGNRTIIQSEKTDNNWFTIDGIKHSNKPKKKIYIRNGKTYLGL